MRTAKVLTGGAGKRFCLPADPEATRAAKCKCKAEAEAEAHVQRQRHRHSIADNRIVIGLGHRLRHKHRQRHMQRQC